MSRSAPISSAPLLALALLASACEQRPEFRYHTEHLRIATDFDEPLCRGDLDHYESVITSLETVLDTSVDGRTDVYLWDYTMTSPGWCEVENSGGCFSDRVVYADIGSIDHELVHLVVASFGSPTAFWNEGAATALQSERTFFSEALPSDHLDLAAPYLDYNTAGHFSRWLFETYGTEQYRALLRAPGSAREAFENTYDMTIEEAQELYVAEAPYSYGALISCNQPELPQVGELQWSEIIDVDCDNPHVHGGPYGMGAYRVLTIIERRDYTFSTTAEGGVISPCKDADIDMPTEYGDPTLGDVPPHPGGSVRGFAGDEELTTLDLIPGRYQIVLGYSNFQPHTDRIDVRAAP